ncbi:MAG: MBL fold metallo-hydrolase [Pseudobdellovibrionaceae bacterium]
MKNLVNVSLAVMAFSTSGCASALKTANSKGRIIEFKSNSNGFDTRTFFYEGENEVVAFDAQFTPELAKQSIAELRKYTNKPISWLVITHPNPDKFNGASVFKSEGAKIIASKKTTEAIPEVHAYKEYYFVEMAKMFKKGEYPQPTNVDQSFTGKMDLILQGGEKIELRELSEPGVSSTQTVAYVDSMGALFVGDLVHFEAHAWLEGGIINGKPTPTIEGWIADLKEISSLYSGDTKIYGGRGITTDLTTAVREQTNYLLSAVQIIDEDLRSLGSKGKDFNGPNSGVLYKNLATKFQQKFPKYALPYMIEYGAYGLVQSEMQKIKSFEP